MTKRAPTRLDRAIFLREALLRWLAIHGELIYRGLTPYLKAAIGRYEISYRMPISEKVEVVGPGMERHTLTWCGSRNPYGLDIWGPSDKDPRKIVKLMNFEWEPDEDDLVSFGPGDWDAELLAPIGGPDPRDL